MAFKLLLEKGCPLDRQVFTWKELVQQPISKLNDDAFTRVRIILTTGIETEALRFSHACSRMNKNLQLDLAKIRIIEQHQVSLAIGLIPPDQSTLESSIACEQTAIELTADIAQREPDPYLAKIYSFETLKDVDHLYRFSALLDRLEGKDPNTLLQSYTDICPGLLTSVEHRSAEDRLHASYDRKTALPLTKFHALTLLAGKLQAHAFYLNSVPQFSDPIARQLYSEMTSAQEQQITQYESLIDPQESWLERWVLHEANEVYNYYSCVCTESDPRIKAIWERFLDYELGHLSRAVELFQNIEKRDAAEILPATLPDPLSLECQRDFIQSTLIALNRDDQVNMNNRPRSISYQGQMNSEGSPSEIVAANYHWSPGTELTRQAAVIHELNKYTKHKHKGAA